MAQPIQLLVFDVWMEPSALVCQAGMLPITGECNLAQFHCSEVIDEKIALLVFSSFNGGRWIKIRGEVGALSAHYLQLANQINQQVFTTGETHGRIRQELVFILYLERAGHASSDARLAVAPR